MSTAAFEAFLAPFSANRFLNEFYSRRPLHIAGVRDRFRHLLPWEDLNQILLQQRLDDRLRLAREGKILEKGKFMKNAAGGTPRLDLSMLNELFQQGWTLVVDFIDEAYAPITELCRMLELVLREYVSTNAYAGWYTTQGFDTHWDDQDVIIVQVAGRKHWRVFEPERKHPVEADKALGLKLSKDQSPAWEGDISAGDLLYIPRGWWHDAVPVGEPTLHLTLTIVRKTGLDFMYHLVKRLRERVEIRADLPRFASAAEQQAYMASLHQACGEALQDLSLEAYLREVDAAAEARVRPSFPWSAMLDSQPLPDSAWLHWQPPRAVPIQETEEHTVFEALGSEFTFAKAAAPVIRELAQTRRIRLDQLCAHHPQLDVKTFIVKLISKGLLTVSARELI